MGAIGSKKRNPYSEEIVKRTAEETISFFEAYVLRPKRSYYRQKLFGLFEDLFLVIIKEHVGLHSRELLAINCACWEWNFLTSPLIPTFNDNTALVLLDSKRDSTNWDFNQCSRITDFTVYGVSVLIPKLHSFNIAGCQTITDWSINKVLEVHSESLRFLNINGLYKLTQDIINSICKYGVNLIELKFGNSDNIVDLRQITTLTNLKTLVVGQTRADSSPIFQLTNLQSLSVFVTEQSKSLKNNLTYSQLLENKPKFLHCHTLQLLKDSSLDHEIWSKLNSTLPDSFPNLLHLRIDHLELTTDVFEMFKFYSPTLQSFRLRMPFVKERLSDKATLLLILKDCKKLRVLELSDMRVVNTYYVGVIDIGWVKDLLAENKSIEEIYLNGNSIHYRTQVEIHHPQNRYLIGMKYEIIPEYKEFLFKLKYYEF